MQHSSSILSVEVGISQTLRLTQSMRQSLAILEMPILELAEWLNGHIDPPTDIAEESSIAELQIGEEEELDFASQRFDFFSTLDPLFEEGVFPEEARSQQPSLTENYSYVEQRDTLSTTSLDEHLAAQAREAFTDLRDLKEACELLAQIDDRGFLPAGTTAKGHILATIQTFDPPGIGARSLRESLILQLRHRKLENSLAFKILSDHFDDLLHHRFEKLSEHLRCSMEDLQKTIKRDLASLSLRPAALFSVTHNFPVVPDLIFVEEEGRLEILVNHAPLSSFFSTSEDRWMEREIGLFAEAVEKRKKTMLRLGKLLIDQQRLFLLGKRCAPLPMSIEQAAAFLSLHPSTVSRAVAHKTVSTPVGTFALRFFFDCSPLDAKEGILRLISEEDKAFPHSDQALSEQLKKLGVFCARRTVTKYRKILKIPSASLRRQYKGGSSAKR